MFETVSEVFCASGNRVFPGFVKVALPSRPSPAGLVSTERTGGNL